MDESYKSIGEMVDRLADQYVAGGMHAYSANFRALLDTALLLVNFPKQFISLYLKHEKVEGLNRVFQKFSITSAHTGCCKLGSSCAHVSVLCAAL